jgi:hypothetical protein
MCLDDRRLKFRDPGFGENVKDGRGRLLLAPKAVLNFCVALHATSPTTIGMGAVIR